MLLRDIQGHVVGAFGYTHHMSGGVNDVETNPHQVGRQNGIFRGVVYCLRHLAVKGAAVVLSGVMKEITRH